MRGITLDLVFGQQKTGGARMTRVVWGALGALAVLAIAHAALPASPLRDATYVMVAAGAVALTWWGLARNGMLASAGWRLLLVGVLLWFSGDVTYYLQDPSYRGADAKPSDVPYLMAYPVFAWASVMLLRTFSHRRNLTALLDALILTAGISVPVFAFMVWPTVSDPTMPLLHKLAATAFPVGDLLVLTLLANLFIAPQTRTRSTKLLVAALLAVLATDATSSLVTALFGADDVPAFGDIGWHLAYLLCAGAANVDSVRGFADDTPTRVPSTLPGVPQLAMLGVGSAMPALTLLAQGMAGAPVSWRTIGFGGAVLSTLVVLRTNGLLRILQRQADTMAHLARIDPLTGLPNRRVWDQTFSRACRRGDPTFSIALLDLDRFKQYNDTFGHQAGDDLLRRAAALWSAGLPENAVLARFGGEEFALYLPGHAGPEAKEVLDRLNLATPEGQSFSAGVCDAAALNAPPPGRLLPGQRSAPELHPDDLLREADAALYAAKSAGRHRVFIAGEVTAERSPHVHPS